MLSITVTNYLQSLRTPVTHIDTNVYACLFAVAMRTIANVLHRRMSFVVSPAVSLLRSHACTGPQRDTEISTTATDHTVREPLRIFIYV
jgi:hypothetical protein